MKSLKEHFKARLMEDLGSPELMDNLDKSGKWEKMDKIARSPFLYIPHPDDPNKAMRIPEARLHPSLSWALSNAAENGVGLDPKEVATIKAFIAQHGHFVGAPNDPSHAYPETFETNDPNSVLSNIFGDVKVRRKR